MTVIEHTYLRLLTDCSRLSGLSLERSAWAGLAWSLYEAPLLEQQLLQLTEHGTPLNRSSWPDWLWPLANRFALLDKPEDLRILRQLLLFCYKAEHAYTDETERKSVADWRSTQSEVAKWESQNIDLTALPYFSRVKHHVSAVLGLEDWNSIVPFHGPGACYENSKAKGKWTKWFTTIDHLYPYGEYFGISRLNYRDGAKGFDIADDIVARLTPVPKDSRGPRLICVHPMESIWIQQGLRIKLEDSITRWRPNGRSKVGWPHGHVHFDDQTVNGQLALAASASSWATDATQVASELMGRYLDFATIDLSEASDRLSDRLVQALFGRSYRYFGSCRAQYCSLPDGSRERIYCYAPMGNATTFPVQSLIFWAVCVATLESSGFHQPNEVYVFGDDIIVPAVATPLIMETLAAYGLKVNQRKSFYIGAFRESCGVDAYKGVDVTPIRWKTTYDATTLLELLDLSSMAQRLRVQGFEECAKECYSFLALRLRQRTGMFSKKPWILPQTNDPEHGGIAEYTERDLAVWECAYWHKHTQQFVSPIVRPDVLENKDRHDWHHVLSSLIRLERRGRNADTVRTELRSDPADAVSRRIQLKRGWTRVR